MRTLNNAPHNPEAEAVAVKASIAAMYQATDAHKNDFPPSDSGAAVAANADGSIKTHSGTGKVPEGYSQVDPIHAVVAGGVGHPLTPKGAEDQIKRGGFPGRSRGTDAEKQLSLESPDDPIGVDKEMCPDCIAWFEERANEENRTFVVTDPKVTRIFRPNEDIQVIPVPGS